VAQGDLNTTSYVILGMLVSQDRSAYEISVLFSRGIAELWPRADRQRYNAPKKLLEHGLVTATVEPVGARSRTMYSITPEGLDALRTWLTTQSRPSALEFEGMIRVLYADQGTLDDLRTNLETMREQAMQSREVFAANARIILDNDGGTFPEREHLLALANRFMIGHFTHIVDWADWALAETQEWSDTATTAAARHHRSREILEASAQYAPPAAASDAQT
jgi:PadR family transcriptional regulator AphA